MKTLSLVYWLRALTGTVAAIVCHLLELSDLRGWVFALAFYAITYYVMRLKWPRVGARRIALTGVGAYFLFWALIWTLLHSLVYMGPV